MINSVKTISTEFDKFKRRVVKVLKGGKTDIQTALELNPFGIDSGVPKNFIAVYARGEKKGDTFIVGYLNKNQLAQTGATRIYSTNEAGDTEKFYVLLTNDGFLELGGNANFAVKYNELATEFNKLKASHNDLASKWNAFCASYVPGSPLTTGLPPSLAAQTSPPNASDITQTKNTKIKTL